MQNTRLYTVFNVLGTIVMLTMNYLANALPLNGKMTGALSDIYPNYFVPAGITFSIWGVIFLLCIFFMVFNLVNLNKKNTKNLAIIDSIGPLYFVSCIANASWLIAWHYDFLFLSVCIMLLLLATLAKIYKKLIPLKNEDIEVIIPTKTTFSVYLGWISVATIANVTTLLVSIGWNGAFLTPHIWAIIMILIALILGIFMLYKYKDPTFAVVIAWALLGIYFKQSDLSLEGSKNVATIAQYSATFLFFYIVLMIVGKKTYFQK